MSVGTIIALESGLSELFRLGNRICGQEPHYGQPTKFHLNLLNLPEINGGPFDSIDEWFQAFTKEMEQRSLPLSASRKMTSSTSDEFTAAYTGRPLFKYHLSLNGSELSISSNSMFGRFAAKEILGDKATAISQPVASIHAEKQYPSPSDD